MTATAAQQTRAVTMVGHTIVCGLDQLGLRVAQGMREMGEDVVVLALNPDRTFAHAAREAGAVIIDGTSQTEDDMIDAGVRTARALVLTEDSDLGNLHAALEAEERNEDIRIVLRMFNTELAQRAAALLNDTEVMSLSGLVAPFLVDEALGESGPEAVTVWDRRVVLRDTPTEDASILAELGGDLLLADGGAAIRAARRVRQRRNRRVHTLEQVLRTLWDRRLATVLLSVAALVTLASLIFWYFAGFSPIDAAYFTITTVTTVGYGDLNLLTQPAYVKVLGMILMILGATSLAAFYALITDAVVGARISAALGVPDGTAKNHFVVCGVGNVGFRVVEHLVRYGYDVTTCDIPDDRGFIEPTRRLGVPVLAGDALVADNLRQLGVEKARAVIATTENDITNLEITLASRELNPNARLVARIFDPELAERAERRFDIHACRSIPTMAAPYFTAAALGPDCNTIIRRGGHLWLLAEAMIMPGSQADGLPLAEMEEDGQLKLVAVRDNLNESWRPDRERVLAAGHEILVAARREALERLRVLTRARG
ncbi:MAG: NAD-binding protein [Candidatus Dormiibacterota bacterium]